MSNATLLRYKVRMVISSSELLLALTKCLRSHFLRSHSCTSEMYVYLLFEIFPNFANSRKVTIFFLRSLLFSLRSCLSRPRSYILVFAIIFLQASKNTCSENNKLQSSGLNFPMKSNPQQPPSSINKGVADHLRVLSTLGLSWPHVLLDFRPLLTYD